MAVHSAVCDRYGEWPVSAARWLRMPGIRLTNAVCTFININKRTTTMADVNITLCCRIDRFLSKFHVYFRLQSTQDFIISHTLRLFGILSQEVNVKNVVSIFCVHFFCCAWILSLHVNEWGNQKEKKNRIEFLFFRSFAGRTRTDQSAGRWQHFWIILRWYWRRLSHVNNKSCTCS